MTTPETAHLLRLIEDLLNVQDPVTFYEAVAVVNAARPITELEAYVLRQILALHDAPHLTDGARAVLAPFLRGHGQRITQQRSLASRPILLKDTGKTARAPQNSVLVLSLEERRASGFLWRVGHISSNARCERLLDRAELPNRAEFKVELLQPGPVDVALTEDVNAPLRPTRTQAPTPRPRHFDLHVIVEPVDAES